MLLFTGLRKTEALTLKWTQVDFAERTLTITDTKNGKPLTLPLSDYLVELLQRRAQHTMSLFVFPGQGEYGHFIEPRKQIDKVKARSGVEFCPHDLRRTFITVAESLKLGLYTIKRLVNHKMSHDVTAGYVSATTEELGEAMHSITDHLLTIVQTPSSPKIIVLEQHRSARSK